MNIHLTDTDAAIIIAMDGFNRARPIRLHGIGGQSVIAMPVDSYTLPDSEFHVIADGVTPPRVPATAHIQ